MCTDRRDFLRLSASLAGAVALGGTAHAETTAAEFFQQRDIPDSIRKLRSMTAGVVPISLAERKARIEKARRLMHENRLDAIYPETGSSMVYYTHMAWEPSERMFSLR